MSWLLGCVLVSLVTTAPASAADWPQRTITLIQPFGAGGVTDRIGRVLADYFSQELGVPVVLEARPGGGGALGSAQVARAAPDGHTLLVSGLASQVTSPLVTPNPNLDTLRDFTHIAYLGGPPVVWAVPPTTDMKSVADVIAGAKAGKVTSFATPGVGTLGHLAAEYVALKAGVEMSNVPYNNQTLADVISGRILLASTAWATGWGHIQGKTLRAVGVTSEGRLKAAPDLPTFREQGYDLAASTWAALSGPAGLPPEIVARLNELVAKFLARSDLLKPLEQDILEIKVMTPQQITTHFKEQIVIWTPVVQSFLAKKK
ncbi:MAG: tripartite tricarboxylate transporter substrate binding protein [Hyphomicrobiales bacterium]|nr:tripartite tricarboxylate transporter substrate binding protein [Hyphomicrobiales bacterium]